MQSPFPLIRGPLTQEGSWRTIAIGGLALATLLAQADHSYSSRPMPGVHYHLDRASGGSSLVTDLKFHSEADKLIFVPRTRLGERLLALRNRAIASGMNLLGKNEILEELKRNRGDQA